MRVLDNTVVVPGSGLARRPSLIAKLMTERNARLKRYGSLLRGEDGRIIAGPAVVRASRATTGSPRVTLRYEGVRMPVGFVPVVMWIMSPSPDSQSLAAWKVPPITDGVMEPVIHISS